MTDASVVVAALEEHGEDFDVLDAGEPRSMDVPVSAVRRRRGRLSDDTESGFRDLTLIEKDGVLLWVPSADVVSSSGGMTRRRAGRRGQSTVTGNVIKEVTVPVLEPNEYIAALRRTDEVLNPDLAAGLRRVRRLANGTFVATKEGLEKRFAGKTLLIVHGTFSKSANSLEEYAATQDGGRFLTSALSQYDRVLVFDHPTLSVSPVINGIDLARAMSGTTGQLDVIAHSRGGLIVRWWLELLPDTVAGAQVRAVLAGVPIGGTSLAAPNRLHPLLHVLTNIGAFVGRTLSLAAASNPFTLASIGLLKFVVRHEKNRWGFPPVDDIGGRPGIDAAVAVIPGLQGQSAVANNYELERLRACSAPANVQYFAVTADFEPEMMGWRLWKVISEFRDRGLNALADKIFPGSNDLVVDVAHMTPLSDTRVIGSVFEFKTQNVVHHCNYFRQPETIASMRKWLGVKEA
jgi:hypothetical protein